MGIREWFTKKGPDVAENKPVEDAAPTQSAEQETATDKENSRNTLLREIELLEIKVREANNEESRVRLQSILDKRRQML